MVKVYACFPGTGKTYAKETFVGLDIADSDSSRFSWIVNEKGEKVRNPEFPANYITEIKRRMAENDVVLVSTHDVVIKALIEARIDFSIIHPARSLKEEYLRRYRERGSDEAFINLLDKNWNNFIDDVTNGSVSVPKICLMSSNDTITDALEELVRYKDEGGYTWLS